MKGFTIICNECGNKAIFITERHKEYNCDFISSDNNTLIHSGNHSEITIECSKCGNVIVEEI